MADNRWRNHRGFTRDIKDPSGAWFVNGPDGEDHALGCMFVLRACVMPCTCDATRRFGSGWHTSWERWMEVMLWNTIPEGMTKPFKWPVDGPDGEPWIPGIDFNDE